MSTRKLLSIAILLTTFLFCGCSKKEITPTFPTFKVSNKTGNLLASDGKIYQVLTFDGYSQKELYDMVRNNIVKAYKSADNVMTEDEPNAIMVDAAENDLIVSHYETTADRGTTLCRYTIGFEFKDGKIKVMPCMGKVTYLGHYQTTSFESLILSEFINWDNQKFIAKEYGRVQDCETKINTFIFELVYGNYIESKSSNGDW